LAAGFAGSKDNTFHAKVLEFLVLCFASKQAAGSNNLDRPTTPPFRVRPADIAAARDCPDGTPHRGHGTKTFPPILITPSMFNTKNSLIFLAIVMGASYSGSPELPSMSCCWCGVLQASTQQAARSLAGQELPSSVMTNWRSCNLWWDS